MCLQIFIHGFRHFRWLGRGGAYDPDFSVDLSRSWANFRSPEILYIFCRNCYTSQADANSSFPSWLGYPSNNHTLSLLLVIYVLLPSICHFSTLQPLSWKVTFSGTQMISPPTVFNLQASNWVHCEEETGAHYSIYYETSKLISFFFLSCLFWQKKTQFSKNSIKCTFEFFFMNIYGTIHIYELYAMITSNLRYLQT